MPKVRTSLTHPIYIDSVAVPGTLGALGMTICPGKKGPAVGGFDWERSLEQDIDAIHFWGAALVVTLMESFELTLLKVDSIQATVQGRGIGWLHCPIPDLNAPGSEFETSWLENSGLVHRYLAEGKKVLLHCRGGLGRTGTIAARILADFGISPKEAIEKVRAARPGTIETRVQEEYVLNYVPEGRRQLGHFQGCLLGGAVGDALGAVVEFKHWPEIEKEFGPKGIRDYAPVFGRIGAITDDTQMTLFTAEGLLRAEHRTRLKGIGPIFAEMTFNSYLRWLKTQGEAASAGMDGCLIDVPELHHRRAPGSTCLEALRKGKMGTLNNRVNDSKGCGGVMRVAPVGLFMQYSGLRFSSEERLDWSYDIGCQLAAITHGHPSGYLAAGAFAQLVSDLIAGTPIVEATQKMIFRLEEESGGQECAGILKKAIALSRNKNSCPGPQTIDQHLGGGWVAEEALAIGLYSVLVYPNDFEQAILLAVNHSGDSDSTGSIAGNIAGALLGAKAIPKRWLEPLELKELITQVATDLFVGCSGEDGWWEKYPGY